MRLHPPVSTDEAYSWLKGQATSTWGEERVGDLEENLKTMAEAMALISAVELPDDLEPLFP
ncbi:MAG: hypothetical protein AB7T37_13160 [Dehalococcoidia bacterium]